MKKYEVILNDNESKMLNELLVDANEKMKDYYGLHGIDNNININEIIGSWIVKKHAEVFKR